MKTLKRNEHGIAHIGLIILVVAVVGAGSFAYWRVSSNSKSAARTAPTAQVNGEALPQNLENLKTLDELEQITGNQDGVDIIKFVLESKDGSYIYKVTLSNGKKLVVDATSGKILSEETTDVGEDDKIPSGIQVTVSPSEAYKIAATKSSSQIKTIEMEVEDKKVVYKIEYQDGSKIEIDASSGSIVKSEIKSESSDEDGEDEDEKDEDGEENRENEDSDDSQDSEDHAEEDKL